MTTASRLGRIIGLLCLTAAFVACSTIKLAYNNIDDVAYWWLDGYVDFTDEQAPRAREDLDRLHHWHRTTELPQLLSLMQAMQQAASADMTGPQACGFVAQARKRLEALAERAEPALVTLATGLTPEQLAHLERKYEKLNANFRDDWLKPAPAEVLDKRVKKFIERSEMVYGTLEEAQRAVVRRQLAHSVFDPRRSQGDRLRRQQDLLQTLRKVAGQPLTLSQSRELLHAYLQRQLRPTEPAHRAYQQAMIDEACANFAALHNSTSAAQRQGAVRRLQAYQRDLRELIAQP